MILMIGRVRGGLGLGIRLFVSFAFVSEWQAREEWDRAAGSGIEDGEIRICEGVTWGFGMGNTRMVTHLVRLRE